jgi:hypothetical protein
MMSWKRAGIILLALMAVLCLGSLEKDQPIALIAGLASPAYAVVGRPLTPVSVAGVGRRTTRRCAADVYDC